MLKKCGTNEWLMSVSILYDSMIRQWCDQDSFGKTKTETKTLTFKTKTKTETLTLKTETKTKTSGLKTKTETKTVTFTLKTGQDNEALEHGSYS